MPPGKKNKKSAAPTQPALMPEADADGLVDDLLAELDTRDAVVQQEAAAVLTEVAVAQTLPDPPSAKKDSKARFKEREVTNCE